MKSQALPRGLDCSHIFLSVVLRFGIAHILFLLDFGNIIFFRLEMLYY